MNRPSLLAAFLLIPVTAVTAHPREDISHVHKPTRLAVATADAEPRARIRGDISGKGLSPQGFNRWLNRHPALVQSPNETASMRILASTALPPHIVTNAFALADRDGNGRISADELADFVMHQSDPESSRYDL